MNTGVFGTARIDSLTASSFPMVSLAGFSTIFEPLSVSPRTPRPGLHSVSHLRSHVVKKRNTAAYGAIRRHKKSPRRRSVEGSSAGRYLRVRTHVQSASANTGGPTVRQ